MIKLNYNQIKNKNFLCKVAIPPISIKKLRKFSFNKGI